MKNHDLQKHEFQELFLTEYRYNDWFDIQDEEKLDDKTLEGIVDIPSMLTLESDEEELKNNNNNSNKLKNEIKQIVYLLY